jgi:cytochrome c-type biogenesis protein CcmH/NrfG
MASQNALSRSIGQVPMWLVQTAVAVLLSSLLAWATWATTATWQHETRLSVLEDHEKTIDQSLEDLKSDTKEILRRMPR